MMASRFNLQAVSSLFEVKFSERSGLVKDDMSKQQSPFSENMKLLQPLDSLALGQTKVLEIQVRPINTLIGYFKRFKTC